MRCRRSSSASTYAWPLAVLLIVLLVQWWEWQRGSTQAPDDVRPPEPAAAPSSPEPLEPEGNWLQGRVRHVFDGDTVELVTSQGTWRVRLKGIDAPEYDQPYGDRAREELGRLCDGQAARVWTTGRDAFDRLLGDLYCGDLWVNGQMVASGHAWHYRRGRQAPILDQLEREARQAGKGLWSQPQPVAPWDHRRQAPRSRPPAPAGPRGIHP